MSGSSYFEVSDDDDPPMQGALIEVQYEPPLDKMKAWNQKRERTVGTVAWALTQHSHYDPSSGTVQFDVKVGTENDVSNAYRFFDRNIKNGQLRFQTAHTAGKEARWIEVNGGYSQDFRDCDNNKPLYQNTTSYARGEDSHVQQNQGVIMLDCSSDSYEQLCKLDKSGMAALDKVARGLMANVLEPVMEVGKEAVLYSAHVLQVSSFGGLTFHVDHNEFDKDVHVTLSVLLAQPDKTVFMAEAAREAKWTGVGQWKVFSSDKFHRSGTILREGAMQLTFFARVKKVCRAVCLDDNTRTHTKVPAHICSRCHMRTVFRDLGRMQSTARSMTTRHTTATLSQLRKPLRLSNSDAAAMRT